MPVSFVYVGKQIKEVRKQCGMSQAYLAEKADMSAQYLSQVETGKKQVSLQCLYNIAQVLDASLDLLTGNTVSDLKSTDTGLNVLLNDCSGYEKMVITEAAAGIKESLKRNKNLIEKDY